jgi:biotin-(acetyl-CoA carboxylase) ligase
MNRTMVAPLDLPPPYRAVVLREHADAFTHACAIAGQEGAGTLVWARRFDSVEMALVLEPDEPLIGARRAVYAVMNAAGDALAAQCPPEKPLAFAWPDMISLDGGILGGVRLAWPTQARDDEPANWIVAGLVLRLALPITRRGDDRASHPLDVTVVRGTSLEVEGFELLDAATLVGSIARHFMVQVDRWQEEGFGPVGRQFMARLASERLTRLDIDANGDLLARRISASTVSQRRSLLEALATPQWLDPQTGDPWL